MINLDGTCSLLYLGGCSVIETTCNAAYHNPRNCEFIDGMLFLSYLKKKAELSGLINHIIMDIKRKYDKKAEGELDECNRTNKTA